ncbi:MAG: methyltransferase domain-containing protein [Thermoanaerobaculia bacterium]
MTGDPDRDAYPYNRAWLQYAWRRWLGPTYEGGAVLDVGSGIGVNGRILSQLGVWHVLGLDLDWGCLQTSRGRGLGVFSADLSRELPLSDGTVELALLIHVIEHLPDGGFLMRAIHRVLRPGGRVVVVTPDWKSAWRGFYDDPTHIRPYSRQSLDAVLAASGFQVEMRLRHNVGYWLGRTGLWRALPRLCFTGDALFAIARKPR